MIFLFVSAIFFILIFSGLGEILSRCTNINVRADNWCLKFFLGAAIAGVYFDAIQFFIPLTLLTLIPIATMGIAGMVIFVRNDLCQLKDNKKIFLLYIIILLIYAYVCADAKFIGASDTMDYHATIVSWLNAYRIIPGLANLHGRYGMNSLLHHLAAGIDVWVWDKQSANIIPTIIEVMYVCYCINDISDINHSISRKIYSMVMLLWLPLSTILNPDLLAPNLYYDTAALIYIVIFITEWFDINEQKNSSIHTSLGCVFLFSAVSFAIKPMGAISVILIFLWISKFLYDSEQLKVSNIMRISIFPVLILLLFILRNIIQTGYPLFPLTWLRCDFIWTLPESDASWTYSAIKDAAVRPGLNSPIELFKSFVLSLDLPYFIISLITIVLIIRSFLRRKNKNAKYFYSFVLINIIYWACSAPNFRFGSAFFYLLFALALYYNEDICLKLLNVIKSDKYNIPFGIIFSIFGLLLRLSFLHKNLLLFGSKIIGKDVEGYSMDKITAFAGTWMIFMGGLLIYKTVKKKLKSENLIVIFCIIFLSCVLSSNNPLVTVIVKSYPVEVRYTNGENPFAVYVSIDSRCGDAPLPCTMTFNENLRLINANSVQDGFYIAQ